MKKYILAGATALVVIAAIIMLVIKLSRNDGANNDPWKDTAIHLDNALSNDNVWLQDTDHDSLKDWEESLWGTDPKVADTDGDGIGDGEEVAALITAGETPARTSEDYVMPDFLTNTGKKNAVATSTPADTETPGETARQKALRDFGNTLAFHISNIQVTRIQYDGRLLSKLATSTPDVLSSLSVLADDYHLMETTLRNISRPGAADSALNVLATGYGSIAKAVEVIVSYKTQGKAPASAIKSYNAAVVESSTLLYRTANFFKSEKIAFSSSEPGYIFTLLSDIIVK